MDFPFKLPLILDGATGTNLIGKGLPVGVCPEKWIIEHKDIIKELQLDFLSAGSDVILAPTFGANRQKLKQYGLEKEVADINKELVDITRQAVNKKALIAGDMSTSGLMVKPYGDACFDDIYNVYFEQANALKLAGVDLLYLETQMSLSDMRAGVLVAKQLAMPIFVTMTVEENGKTIMGEEPLAILLTLQNMGADAVGINCSCGPESLVKIFDELVHYATVPLIAKPNAGTPSADNPQEYSLSVDDFARQMSDVYNCGVSILGGCCGTTAKHIEGLSRIIKNNQTAVINTEKNKIDSCVVNGRAYIIDESDKLSSPLQCSYDMIDDVLEMEDDGRTIILFEVNDIGDADILIENVHMMRQPIAINTSNSNVLEYALKNIQGQLIVDAKSCIDRIILTQITKKYGAIIY